MSDRQVAWAGWLLVAASVGCIAGLQHGLINHLDHWMVLPFAALFHGAMLPAVAASALSWKRGGTALRVTSRILAAIMVGIWLHTWFPPLQKLVAQIAIGWYYWTQV